jgi:hypothetical protein
LLIISWRSAATPAARGRRRKGTIAMARKWWTLAAVATGVFMLVLDGM